MRRIVSLVLACWSTAPLAAQGRMLARFSEAQWREPTFVVDRAAYVAIFEVLDGGRVAQRYPRVEAQGAFALPAGETLLSDLDVNVGRMTEPPGSRTVFWSGGSYGTRPVATGSAPTARVLVLVASPAPLRVVPSSEFPALFQQSLAGTDSSLERRARTVAAIVAAVRPTADAEVATDIATMWLVSYHEFRGAGRSLAAGDPISRGAGCETGGYGIGILTTYSLEAACGPEFAHAQLNGSWGFGWAPFYPVYYTQPRRSPAAPTVPVTIGVRPGQRVTPTGPFGGGGPGVVRVAEPVVEQLPALRTVRWSGPIAGTSAEPGSAAPPMIQPSRGGSADRPSVGSGVRVTMPAPILVAPSSGGARPGGIAGSPPAAPAGSRRGPASAAPVPQAAGRAASPAVAPRKQ